MTALTPRDDARDIRSYHAHVYFRDLAERERALSVRAWIADRFVVQLGRIHDVLVGPHAAPMYQVAFARALFAELVPWLLLNRSDLSVLVHPNTGRARDDHLVHALWLGAPLSVRADALTNTQHAVSEVVPNTTPTAR